MELKNQIALGTSAVLGSLLLFYIYKISTSNSSKPPKEPSKARKLLSRYKPRPSAEDICKDNTFNRRVVTDNVISESGILYHDIRYPREEDSAREVVAASCNEDQMEEPSAAHAVSHDEVKNIPISGDVNSLDEKHKDEPSMKVKLSDNAPIKDYIKDEEIVDANDTKDNRECIENEPMMKDDPSKSEIMENEKENVDESNVNGGSHNTSSIDAPLLRSVQENGIQGSQPPPALDVVRNIVAVQDKVRIQERREANRNNSNEMLVQCFNVPSRAVGKIIGKGGQTIKSIQRESGASLKFPESRDRSKPSQCLFVSGTLRQVEEAVARLVSLMPSDSYCHDLLSWTPQKALSGDLVPIAEQLVENTIFVGRVTHVESPESIWIQVCRDPVGFDYLNTLAHTSDNIRATLGRKMYDLRNALIPMANIKEGTNCAVMLEDKAFRGTVLVPGTPDNEVHLVRLVDFGTSTTFTELFKLESYYYTMPAIAVQCSLAHIVRLEQDPIWPEQAASYLEDSLINCFVKVKILEAGLQPSVEVYTQPTDGTEPKYINREMVYEGYAKWMES